MSTAATDASVMVAIGAANRTAAARSEVYKILSRVFSYCGDDESRRFVLRDAGDALKDAVHELPYAVPAVAGLKDWSGGSLDVEILHCGLFDGCTGRTALSLHEKDYSTLDPKELWEDLIRFYEHFGLNYDLGTCRQWPDWIGIELEFLHYLTFLEAAAADRATASYVAAEADFLDRHLAVWIPTLGGKLAAKAVDTPYAAYAQVLTEFVAAEAAFNRGRRHAQ